MTDMPRPRPPFLRREVTRHGTVVWYVRKGEEQRVRIRAAFGTSAFDAEYQAALNATPRPAKGGPTSGSIAWLIERYQDTTAWGKLSKASRRQRQNMLAQVIEEFERVNMSPRRKPVRATQALEANDDA